MNRPLDSASIEALSVRLEDYLPAPAKGHGKRFGGPFSKRAEGKARRKARKAAEARRMSWLNS